MNELKAALSQDAKVAAYHSFMAEVFPRASRVCQLFTHDEVSLYKAIENIFCPRVYDMYCSVPLMFHFCLFFVFLIF